MDAIVLVKKMIEWSELQTSADVLRDEIERVVRTSGKTVTVANIVATFRNPRKTYQYRQAVEEAGYSEETLIEMDVAVRRPEPTIDWKLAAGSVIHESVEIPYTESNASASLRMKK